MQQLHLKFALYCLNSLLQERNWTANIQACMHDESKADKSTKI